ncbi:MAG TPA: OmpA family protein [Saprospiraceae bacterium]|nr:OmpA family protein [Saprospiraceae bacterium]HMQ81707.1 OmpA family protein [Saprospiraceae bacterium]
MRFLALLIFLLFGVYVIFARWYFVCEVRQLCGEKVEEVRLKTLKLTQGDEVLLSGYDQFVFAPDSIEPRLNSNNDAFLDTVATILKKNAGLNLTITAFYGNSEQNNTQGYFENLGVERADQIRKLLMKRGIAESRFSLDHGISEDTELKEPLLFDLYDPNSLPDDFEKVLFTFTNMTFSDANYEYNSALFKPGDAFRLYADSVKTYLGLNADASLTIVGHTDSIGSDAYNDKLGLERAISARQFFVDSLNVNATINVESEGERRPVAPNSTPKGKDNPEGRQKNRRVNFIIETQPE